MNLSKIFDNQGSGRLKEDGNVALVVNGGIVWYFNCGWSDQPAIHPMSGTMEVQPVAVKISPFLVRWTVFFHWKERGKSRMRALNIAYRHGQNPRSQLQF
jgi:hypothetical protein